MDYFNLAKLIRNVVYNFMRMFRYLSMSLICLCFIALCLLLMSTKSNATVILNNSDNDTSIEVDDFPDDSRFNGNNVFIVKGSEIEPSNSWYNQKIFAYTNTLYDSGDWRLRKESMPNAPRLGFASGGSWANNSTMWYATLNSDGIYENWTYLLTFNGFSDVNYGAYSENVNSIAYSKVDVMNQNTHTYIVTSSDFSVGSPFTAPSLHPGYEYLTTGEFTFFVVQPGDIPKNHDILMDVYDTTYSDIASTIAQRYILNQNSIFILESDTYEDGYAYFLTARFLRWFQVVNGKSYKVRLSWVNPDNPMQVDSIEYTWTMSLTAEQQQTEEQTTQQEINQGIENLNENINELNNTQQETNDFLKDDTYDKNDIVSNMPSSDEYSDPTSSGFDNIFTSFRNAFTTNDVQSVIFEIPNSNGQTIEIRADLVSSHVPSPILLLIQSFYWFLICRYILKDISSTVEKAKSGEILDSNDGNIKTDLL